VPPVKHCKEHAASANAKRTQSLLLDIAAEKQAEQAHLETMSLRGELAFRMGTGELWKHWLFGYDEEHKELRAYDIDDAEMSTPRLTLKWNTSPLIKHYDKRAYAFTVQVGSETWFLGAPTARATKAWMAVLIGESCPIDATAMWQDRFSLAEEKEKCSSSTHQKLKRGLAGVASTFAFQSRTRVHGVSGTGARTAAVDATLVGKLNEIKLGDLIVDTGMWTSDTLDKMGYEELESLVLLPLLLPAIEHALLRGRSSAFVEDAEQHQGDFVFEKASTRMDLVKTLDSVIGPPPENADAVEKGLALIHRRVENRYSQMYCEGGMDALRKDADFANFVNRCCESGFTREGAEFMEALGETEIQDELCRSVQRGDRKHAAVIHHAYAILAKEATESPIAEDVYGTIKGPDMYHDLNGSDVRWGQILIPDENGFRGETREHYCLPPCSPLFFNLTHQAPVV
jgi:hypothetical protein